VDASERAPVNICAAKSADSSAALR